MKTALITHKDALAHVIPENVPEQVARLSHVLSALQDLDLLQCDAPVARDADILRCHTAPYVENIRAAIPSDGFTCLDEGSDDETFLSPGSMNAIWRAVGGAISGVDLVLKGRAKNAFVAMRPPGHHAEQAQAMGFCIFGNIAIAAKHALDHHGLNRVAVIDFDVHHGNGTQALLQDDPRVLFISSQQMPLWPGTGDASDQGPHGTVVNIPLAPETDGAHALKRYQEMALPALRAHQPELILISAGFDAHRDDPLAELCWTADDYAEITKMITKTARELCKGRVVSVLEGGYNLQALAVSVRAHVKELMKAAP